MGWRDNRYDDEDDDLDIGRPRPRREAPAAAGSSGWAVTSFVIAILDGLLLFILIVIAGVMSANQNAPMADNDPRAMALGFGILGGLALAVLGVTLGFVGLSQKTGTVFAILGIVLNGLILLGVVGLLCLGMAMG